MQPTKDKNSKFKARLTKNATVSQKILLVYIFCKYFLNVLKKF